MITPLDIQNKEFKKSVRGYNESEVDAFLDQVMADYEQLFKENMELKEQLERDSKQVEKYKQMEETLKETLVVAQSSAEELRSNALKKADLLVEEAEMRAKEIVASARRELERIHAHQDEVLQQIQIFKTRFKTLLQAQLETIVSDTDEIANDLKKYTHRNHTVTRPEDHILERFNTDPAANRSEEE
ncbi:DivIVA domain-containing protein [Anoxynatronum buryatiense]|uniref:Cell division initiation protein n=1 Tax=Anoxynatronum buryatiense TaxID=489973 RepID=A0AA45WUD0_9CLOT|nr:DivIVA domain-containing protein [Anoxynatronum buryatiense]SMP46795.1 cell division initiation protein [Anoxynatronum buryatiense]